MNIKSVLGTLQILTMAAFMSVPSAFALIDSHDRQLIKGNASENLGGFAASGRKKALVIGAGPGGLSSAIMLERLGFEVLVVEKRKYYERANVVAIKPQFLKTLKKSNADVCVREELSYPKHIDTEFEDFTEGLVRVDFQDKDAPASDENLNCQNPYEVASAPTVGIVSINYLERGLNKAALQREHLSLVVESQVDLSCPEGGAPCQANLVRANGTQEKLPAFDLIVAVDGAASKARTQMGIEDTQKERNQEMLIGTFRHELPEDILKVGFRSAKNPKGENQSLTTIILGQKNKDLLAISMQVPTGSEFKPEEMGEILKDKLAKLIPEVKRNKLELLAVDPKKLIIKGHRASKMSNGKNFVLLGDAAGADSLVAGLGVSMTGTHVEALEPLARRILEATPGADLSKDFSEYDKKINLAVSAWEDRTNKIYKNIDLLFSVPWSWTFYRGFKHATQFLQSCKPW